MHIYICMYIYVYIYIYTYIWIVRNANDMLENIQDINTKKQAKNLSTFDFSTLYTNIEHNALKETIEYIS